MKEGLFLSECPSADQQPRLRLIISEKGVKFELASQQTRSQEVWSATKRLRKRVANAVVGRITPPPATSIRE